MVPKIFYNSKTAKTDNIVTDIREIYGCIKVFMHFLLFLIFQSIIRINIRTGGNKKQRFQFNFFSICQIKRSAGSVNQSIVKKA